MKIKSLVVDDVIFNATSITTAINETVSSFAVDSISYTVIQECSGASAFMQAKSCLLAGSAPLDLIVTDYNLLIGLGVDLLLMADPTCFIYKVLTSITDQSFLDAQKGKLSTPFNDVASSKDTAAVSAFIKVYEEKILAIKLYGNPQFRPIGFRNRMGYLPAAQKVTFASISLYDILYAKSLGNDNIEIGYRNWRTFEIDVITRTGWHLPFFIDSDYRFKRISSKIAIHLLWVADINGINKTVSFLTLNNKPFHLSYEAKGDYFAKEILSFLPDIQTYIPSFLKR